MELLEDLISRKEKLIAEKKEMIKEARVDIYKLQEDVYSIAKKIIASFTFALFLNLFMVVWYDQDRSLFIIILQTVHMVAIVVLVKSSIPTFMAIRKCNIKIKEALKKLDHHDRDNKI